jgi:hypothetical protein
MRSQEIAKKLQVTVKKVEKWLLNGSATYVKPTFIERFALMNLCHLDWRKDGPIENITLRRGKIKMYNGIRILVDHHVSLIDERSFIGTSHMLKAEAFLRDELLDNIQFHLTTTETIEKE